MYMYHMVFHGPDFNGNVFGLISLIVQAKPQPLTQFCTVFNMSEKMCNLEGIVNYKSSFWADFLSTLRLQFISEVQAIKENPLEIKVYFNSMQASLVVTEILQIPYLITTLNRSRKNISGRTI